MMFNSPSRFLKDIDRTYFEARSASPERPSFGLTDRFTDRLKSPVSGAPKAIESEWKAGDRVTHRVFGVGTVVRVYRDEVTENDKIEIKFAQQGTKTLLLTHAKLGRI